MLIPDALRDEWGDYVWWDRAANAPQAAHARRGRREVARSATRCSKARSRSRWPTARRSAAGRSSTWSRSTRRTSIPKTVEELTWAPAAAVEALARAFRQGARHDAVRRRHGPEPVLQQRQQGPRHLPAGRADRQRRQDRRQRRLVRRQLPRRAVQRRAAVHQREPVRPRTRSGQAGAAQAVLESRSRRTTTTTRTIRSRRQQAADRQDAHAHARPSRCGSPTPTRSWAT